MPTAHMCKATDVDEKPPRRKKRSKPLLIRDAVLTAPDFMVMMVESADWVKKAVDELGLYCRYTCQRPSRGIRRKIMDTKDLAEKWEKLIIGLATAHDRIERDVWEHEIDEYLSPILSAPVKQVREFFGLLVQRLKSNKSVPFFVWRSLEVWEEGIIKNAKDQDVKELKVNLARQIAELVEEDVKRDIGEAVVGALMWRDQETLQKIKKTLVKSKKEGTGVKVSTQTRAVGRQSCLFLVVEAEGKENIVML